MDDIAAAALVTGTGVGGGFLALPFTTAAAGYLPSSTVMATLWLILYGQSIVVADVIIDASARAGTPVSYGTVARKFLGPAGGWMVSALFLVRMLLTHISQFAKGGSMLATTVGLSYLQAVVLVGTTISAFTLLGPVRLVGVVNMALTVGFVGAVGVLFAMGAPLASWSRLLRADWSHWWNQVPPVLQILVYLEVLPTVCRLLNFDRHRVRRAILAGASCLLLLDLGWSALGIGLVPVATAGGGRLAADPVDVLLKSGGPVAAFINVLAGCAIVTTVIATNLALQTFFADACRGRRKGSAGLLCALSVAIPVMISAMSPGIFFRAIGLQGAYPLTILWGCLPPLIALRMGLAMRSRLPRAKLALISLLLAVAVTSLAGRITTDLSHALG